MFKVLCINDKGRPSIISISKWIKKDEWYTVVDLVKCNIQGGVIGYKLAEIDLSGNEEPYTCFLSTRFGIPKEELVLEEEEQLAL